MANQFDDDLIIEPASRVIWRTTGGTDILEVMYTGFDPNGNITDAPIGALAAGATGLWRCTAPGVWALVSGPGSGSVVTQAGMAFGQSVTSAIGGPQLLASINIGAGALDAIGRTFRVTYAGRAVQSDLVTTVRHLLLLDGVTMLFNSGDNAPSGVGAGFSLDFTGLIRVAGIAGEIGFRGLTHNVNDSTLEGGGDVVTPVDVAAGSTLQVWIEFNAINALNQVDLDLFTVDLVS